MSAEQEVVETTPAAQRNGHVVKLERLIAQGKTNDEIVEVMGKDKVHASLIAKVRKRLEDANAADGVIEPPATKRGRGQRGRDKTSQLIDKISVSGEVLKPAAKRYGKSTLPKVEKDEKFPILEVPINDLNCIVIDAVVSLDPERVLQYRELWKIYDKGELAWNKPMKAVEMEGGELFLAGGRHRIQAAVDNGRKTVPIEIPAGSEDGLQLRKSGEGEPAPRSGVPGHLYIVLHVQPHRFFKRQGNDLLFHRAVPSNLYRQVNSKA